MRASTLRDCLGGFIKAACVTVAAAMRDRVEAVGNRDDARRERNSLPFKSARITAPVPAFVVRLDALAQVRVKGVERRQHLGSASGMSANRAPFLRCELRLVVEDVRQSLVQLPNIVEQSDSLDTVEHSRIEISGFPEHESVRGDAADVRAGHGIVRLDRIEKSFQRRRAKSFRLCSTAVLLIRERAGAGGSANGDWKDFPHATALRKKWTQYCGR